MDLRGNILTEIEKLTSELDLKNEDVTITRVEVEYHEMEHRDVIITGRDMSVGSTGRQFQIFYHTKERNGSIYWNYGGTYRYFSI